MFFFAVCVAVNINRFFVIFILIKLPLGEEDCEIEKGKIEFLIVLNLQLRDADLISLVWTFQCRWLNIFSQAARKKQNGKNVFLPFDLFSGI